MARMNVILDDSLVETLRRKIPRRSRSRFISEAVQEKLARLRQAEAVAGSAGAWSEHGAHSVDDEVRELRESWTVREQRLPSGEEERNG
jgi:metal-responsive CopG/Arc/MetJ family transcriptional regulator